MPVDGREQINKTIFSKKEFGWVTMMKCDVKKEIYEKNKRF